jgi:hypothetical protein
MSFAFCAAGIGEALITSTHTSFAAARAPARLPAAALLQIPSTLLLVLAGSVGSRAMINLQIAVYSFTPEASVGVSGVVGVVAVVVDVLVAVVVVVGVLAVVAGVLAAVELVAGVLVAVEPLVVELPLLPQAARSAEHNNATTGSAVRLPIIDPPWFVRALADGRPADRQTR